MLCAAADVWWDFVERAEVVALVVLSLPVVIDMALWLWKEMWWPAK